MQKGQGQVREVMKEEGRASKDKYNKKKKKKEMRLKYEVVTKSLFKASQNVYHLIMC